MEKEGPSHTNTFLCGPLQEEHVILHQVKLTNGLSGVLPPQHVKAQLDARHIIQTDDGPFEAKASHTVKVIRSHRHLSLGNMKGVGSAPPPLNEALHQGSTHRLLWKKTANRLEACLLHIASGFRDKKFEPLHHLIGASPTSIRG